MTLRKHKYSGTDQAEKDATASQVHEAALAYGSPAGPARYLGLAASLSPNSNRQQNQLKLIRGGLSRASLDVLMKQTGISLAELADMLEVTDRTLRRYDAHALLNKRLSERVLEIANLYARGEEVFGDAASFRQWMYTEVPALGHQKPTSFLDTSMGIQMLMDELGRIEQGVFA